MYQSTVYGLAAKLPFKYTGAVVLGSNLSGTIISVINLVCIAAAPDARTAAIYYFITALFILLACFDTYFALPLNVSNIAIICNESLKVETPLFLAVFPIPRSHVHPGPAGEEEAHLGIQL